MHPDKITTIDPAQYDERQPAVVIVRKMVLAQAGIKENPRSRSHPVIKYQARLDMLAEVLHDAGFIEALPHSITGVVVKQVAANWPWPSFTSGGAVSRRTWLANVAAAVLGELGWVPEKDWTPRELKPRG